MNQAPDISSPKSSLLRRYGGPLALALPFLLWLFMFRDFVSGQIVINIDTNAHFTFTKYYINNLLNGVMPLWEPFVFWGRPFVPIVNAGLLNPLVYLVALGVKLGLDYYQAYMCFILVYYFIGLLGFYLLARIFLKHEFYAYLAYICLLFSGMGPMVFIQMYVLLLFVPTVWFFYFAMRFFRSWRPGDFLGLVYALMIAVTSYYPFYLITVLGIFFVCALVLYYEPLKAGIAGSFRFILSHKSTVLLGIVGLMMASLPLGIYKLRDQSGEVISPTRHLCSPYTDESRCFEGSEMIFEETSFGGTFGERVSFRSLFSHLDKMSYGSDDCFYIPIFCYLIIIVSFFVPIDRKRLFVLMSGFGILLVSLGVATPVHPNLFQYVFYFKYFRNFFFFMAFLIPMVILFSMAQLKAMMEYELEDKRQRLLLLGLVVILHGLFGLILDSQGNIIFTSYLTVFLTLLFFLAVYGGAIRRQSSTLIPIFFFLIILQPGEVFYQYQHNAEDCRCQLPVRHEVPKFSFTRPDKSLRDCFVYDLRDFDFESNLAFRDSSGSIISMPDSISRWAFFMGLRFKKWSHVQQYLKNKFYAYSHAEYYHDPDQKIIGRVEKAVTSRADRAFVFSKNGGPTTNDEHRGRKNRKNRKKESVTVLTDKSKLVEVLSFDVNSLVIATHFTTPKFLVYTDNFNSNWKASINGRRAELYRANIAFKGVWVPAGSNIVKYSFEPVGGTMVYVGVAIFFVIFFLYTVVVLGRETSTGLDAGRPVVS